ncbi:MAG: hypothetical protein R3F60_28575 [bacterium]
MTALLALLVGLAAPPAALWIERDGADLRLSSDLSGLLDAPLAHRLGSGLTTTLHLRVEIRRHPDGELAGDTWRGARVRWELWEEKVTAVVDGPDGSRVGTWPSVAAFVADFGRVEGVVVARGVAADDQTLRATARLEVNPLTADQVARMRSWLASPRADAALDPLSGSLLGSFARFFDNLRPGVAERVIVVEGHPFRADRLPFFRPPVEGPHGPP